MREFRTEAGISQAEFARRAGVDSRALGTYEHGRVPLPFYVFLRAYKQFNISPLWLAIGAGTKRLDWYFEEDYFSRAIGERELFSAVWDRDLKKSCARESANLVETIGFTICDLDELNNDLGHPVDLPAAQLRVLLSRVHSLASRVESLLKDTVVHRNLAQAEKADLTLVPQTATSISVTQLTFTRLLERALRVTALRGKKSALAGFLKVSRSRVTEWLSGSVEPGAAVAFQMLAWVEQEEAKQKSADKVTASPTPKTQRRSSDETKPTSGRRKK